VLGSCSLGFDTLKLFFSSPNLVISEVISSGVLYIVKLQFMVLILIVDHDFVSMVWSFFLKDSFLTIFLSLSNGLDSIVIWTIFISFGTSRLWEFIIFINFQFSWTKFHWSVYTLLILSWRVSINFNDPDLISELRYSRTPGY
jgi:hypothetical protein